MIAKFGSLVSSVRAPGLRQSSILSLLQGLIGASVFFLSIRLLIRESGTEVVGLWSLVVGVVALARMLDFCNGSVLVRLVAMCSDDSHRKKEFIDTVTIAAVFYYGIVLIVGLFILPMIVSGMFEAEYVQLANELLPWALVSLVSLVLMTTHTSALDGAMRATTRAKIMLAGYFLFGLGCVFLVPTYGVFGLAAAQVGQQIFCLIIARVFLVRHIAGLSLLPTCFSGSAFQEALRLGTKTQMTSVPTIIYEPVARIMINHFAGLSTLAIYDLAYKLCSQTRLMLEAAANPLVPQFARSYRSDPAFTSELYRKAMRWSIRGAFTSFATLIALSPFVSIFLFGSISFQFLASVSLLSLAWGVASIGIVPKFHARAINKFRWTIAGEWTIAGLTVLLSVVVANLTTDPSYIFIGPAMAIGIGSTVAIWGNTRPSNTFS